MSPPVGRQHLLWARPLMALSIREHTYQPYMAPLPPSHPYNSPLKSRKSHALTFSGYSDLLDLNGISLTVPWIPGCNSHWNFKPRSLGVTFVKMTDNPFVFSLLRYSGHDLVQLMSKHETLDGLQCAIFSFLPPWRILYHVMSSTSFPKHFSWIARLRSILFPTVVDKPWEGKTKERLAYNTINS